MIFLNLEVSIYSYFPELIILFIFYFIYLNNLIFRDEENEEGTIQSQLKNADVINVGGNPFLEIPSSLNAVEYKKGYVMRKCCYEANAKRSESFIFT